MKNKLTKEQFFSEIKRVEEAISVNGVHYSEICMFVNEITGIRDTTQKKFLVKADELYRAYFECDKLNTTVLKDYISTRAQSPALAILSAAGLV